MQVNSIFKSIAGEVNGLHQGRVTAFVRLQGCNIRCPYCDTPDSLKVTEAPLKLSITEITKVVTSLNVLDPDKIIQRYVCITGGEPLIQQGELAALVSLLYARGWHISIETNGTISPFDITGRWATVDSWIVDYKCPSTGYQDKMDESFHINLTDKDIIKFVIADEVDFDYALRIKRDLQHRGCEAQFAFSPVHGKYNPRTLYEALDAKGIEDAIINVQVHKYLDMA